MWQNADPGWIVLDWESSGDVVLTRAKHSDGATAVRSRISAAVWLVSWDRYRRAGEAVHTHMFATFTGSRAEVVARAQQELCAACIQLYAVISEAVAFDLGSEPTVIIRSPRFATLSLARLVALARPDLLRTRRLPWDLPVGGSVEAAPSLARAVTRWTLPAPSDLTIIAPQELELERSLAGPVHDPRAAESVARIARWLVQLERALDLARRAGAQVIRPAQVQDVLEALEGRHRRCVQIIGHISARDMLYLDGEQLSLRRLATEVTALTRDGWRSSVRTLDLVSCSSEALLAKIMRTSGIEYVSGRAEALHPGAVTRWLHALYAHNLLDGATPLAHAWLLAALEKGCP